MFTETRCVTDERLKYANKLRYCWGVFKGYVNHWPDDRKCPVLWLVQIKFSFLLKLIIPYRFYWQPISSDNKCFIWCKAAAVASDSHRQFYCLKVAAGSFKCPQQRNTLQNTLQSQVEWGSSCWDNTVKTLEYMESICLIHDIITTVIIMMTIMIKHLKSE